MAAVNDTDPTPPLFRLTVSRSDDPTGEALLGWIGWCFRAWPDDIEAPWSWLLAQAGSAGSSPARVLVESPRLRQLPPALQGGPASTTAGLDWLGDDGRRWISARTGTPPPATLRWEPASDLKIALSIQPEPPWAALAPFQANLRDLQVLWPLSRHTTPTAAPAPEGKGARSALSLLDERAFALAAFKREGGTLSPADRAMARWIQTRLLALAPQHPSSRALSESLLDAGYASMKGESAMLSLRVGRLSRA